MSRKLNEKTVVLFDIEITQWTVIKLYNTL